MVICRGTLGSTLTTTMVDAATTAFASETAVLLPREYDVREESREDGNNKKTRKGYRKLFTMD